MVRVLSSLTLTAAIFCAVLVVAVPDRMGFDDFGDGIGREFEKYNDKERNRYEDDGYVGRRYGADESRGGGGDGGLQTTSEAQDYVNRFVDYILHALGSLGMVSKTRAHIPLPNVRKHFSKKWFGINFTGEATLYNCYIENGLSTIHRIRDGQLATSRNGTHVAGRIRFEFRIKYLQIASNFTIKFLKHGPSGQFLATSDEIVVGTEIGISTRRGGGGGGGGRGGRRERSLMDLLDGDRDFDRDGDRGRPADFGFGRDDRDGRDGRDGNGGGNGDGNLDTKLLYWDYITFEGLDFKIIEIWSSTKKIIKIMNPFISKMYKRRLTDNIKYKLESLMGDVIREAGSPNNNKELADLARRFL